MIRETDWAFGSEEVVRTGPEEADHTDLGAPDRTAPEEADHTVLEELDHIDPGAVGHIDSEEPVHTGFGELVHTDSEPVVHIDLGFRKSPAAGHHSHLLEVDPGHTLPELGRIDSADPVVAEQHLAENIVLQKSLVHTSSDPVHRNSVGSAGHTNSVSVAESPGRCTGWGLAHTTSVGDSNYQ